MYIANVQSRAIRIIHPRTRQEVASSRNWSYTGLIHGPLPSVALSSVTVSTYPWCSLRYRYHPTPRHYNYTLLLPPPPNNAQPINNLQTTGDKKRLIQAQRWIPRDASTPQPLASRTAYKGYPPCHHPTLMYPEENILHQCISHIPPFSLFSEEISINLSIISISVHRIPIPAIID